MLEHAIDNPGLDACYGKDISKAIIGKLSHTHTGGAKPQIILVVHHNVVYGVIEFYFIDNMEIILHIKKAYAVFSSD